MSMTLFCLSCEVLDTNFKDKSYVFLKINPDKTESFVEIKNIHRFTRSNILGIEKYDQTSFILTTANDLTSGVHIKLVNNEFKVDSVMRFTIQNDLLTNTNPLNYKWKSKLTSEKIIINEVTTDLTSHNQTDAFSLTLQDAIVVKDKEFSLPSKVIGDSIFVNYSFIAAYHNLQNTFLVNENRYKLKWNNFNNTVQVTFDKKVEMAVYFSENPLIEPTLVPFKALVQGNAKFVHLNENEIVLVNNSAILLGNKIDDGYITIEIGDLNSFVNVDNDAVYFQEYLYDKKRHIKLRYSEPLYKRVYWNIFQIGKTTYFVNQIDGNQLFIQKINKETLKLTNGPTMLFSSYPQFIFNNSMKDFITLGDGTRLYFIVEMNN